MQVTANKEIISIEMSTTNLDLARDRQIRRRENIIADGMNRDRTCTSMRHPSPCRDKSRHLTTELSTSTKKIDAPGTVTSCWLEQTKKLDR